MSKLTVSVKTGQLQYERVYLKAHDNISATRTDIAQY